MGNSCSAPGIELNMRFFLILLLGLCGGALFARDLESEISDLTGKLDATVGVALLCGDDALVLNNDVRYPIMSTFKFHIAVTVLHQMEMSGTALDSPVCIEAAQIRETTWSPLREKYPSGSINTTMREVLEYAISHSDNNACDWLIDYAGGISVVDAYVRSLGVDGFCLTETEAGMEEDIYRTYNNWSTPLSMAAFLRKVYSGNVLGEEYFRFLEQAMLGTNTGLNKLRAGLPDDVPIGHKTGMSFRTPEGVRMCEADSGVIYLPDGRKLYLVVFVKDSTESDDANAKIMADICRVVYEYVGAVSSACLGG